MMYYLFIIKTRYMSFADKFGVIIIDQFRICYNVCSKYFTKNENIGKKLKTLNVLLGIYTLCIM